MWTYTVYEGDHLNVDHLSSEEVPDPKAKSTSTKAGLSPKPKVAKPEHDLAHHTTKMSPRTQALFELLREAIVDLGDDVTERFMNQYVGYRRLKNFCEVVGLRSKLNVFIDGAVDDPANVCDDVSSIGHWGTGNLRATVTSEDDVTAVVPLIAQAYALQQ